MGGGEQQIARSDIRHHIVGAIARGSRRNEIEFVAQVRRLHAFGGTRCEADLEIAVNKNFR
jgi:hypothetical protein